MSIAAYIKEIGRGHAGARSLGIEQARDLMGQVLDRCVTDLEVGAFALAMRIKGESCDELLGFGQAVQARCLVIPSDQPVIVIPSYNGARRLPNLTPLLALHLARQGARVLVHGPLKDPTRVTSAEVLQAHGLPICGTLDEVHQAWRRTEPAFVATATLCPPLQWLLDVRWTVGLRNSGHTIAKLINPIQGAPALQLASHTHPEFGALMAQYAERSGASMMLLRGTEGEAVADARRAPRLEVWLAGQRAQALCSAAQEGPLTALPNLPTAIDAASVAAYQRQVLSGAEPLPAPLQLQAHRLLQALQALRAP
jgi:anthranilate phosphoribosyltransferase